MCDPVTMAVTGFAISAASTVAQVQGQSAMAAQVEAENKQARQRANRSLTEQYATIQQRQMQEAEAAAVQKQDAQRETRAAAATAQAAAGESGVSGLSVDSLLRDFYGRGATFNDRVDQQTEWSAQQMNREMLGMRATAEDRMNSLPTPQKPNFFDAGLRIAGAGMNSLSDYRKLTKTS